MSTGRYFVTQDQEEAKNWRMLKQRNQIREKVARLEDELKRLAGSWEAMARVCASPSSRVFKFDEEIFAVLNSHDGEIAKVSRRHFDQEKIEDLFADLENSKDELRAANESLRNLGVE